MYVKGQLTKKKVEVKVGCMLKVNFGEDKEKSWMFVEGQLWCWYNMLNRSEGRLKREHK